MPIDPDLPSRLDRETDEAMYTGAHRSPLNLTNSFAARTFAKSWGAGLKFDRI